MGDMPPTDAMSAIAQTDAENLSLSPRVTALKRLSNAQLRWPYAHIFVLWLGPLLGWLACWQVAWQGGAGWLMHWCALCVGAWWGGRCLTLLGPPEEGEYARDRGRLWAGNWHRIWARAYRVLEWPCVALLLACWWSGWGLAMAALLPLMALLVWLPSFGVRVWIGERGVWSLGRDIRYVDFGLVTTAAWVEPGYWLAEMTKGWPLGIIVPDPAAGDALEAAFQLARETESAEPDTDAKGLDEAGLKDEGQDKDQGEDAASVVDEIVGVVGATASRGRWRHGLALLWGVGWAGWWGKAAFGADARFATPWSFGALALLLIGGLVGIQWSRWPPSWLGLGWGHQVWRWDDAAVHLFRWWAVPWALVALGVSAHGLWVQLWSVPTLFFSLSSSLGWFAMMSLSLFVLTDPTGCVVWLCERDGRWTIRRYGWIEWIGPLE